MAWASPLTSKFSFRPKKQLDTQMENKISFTCDPGVPSRRCSPWQYWPTLPCWGRRERGRWRGCSAWCCWSPPCTPRGASCPTSCFAPDRKILFCKYPGSTCCRIETAIAKWWFSITEVAYMPDSGDEMSIMNLLLNPLKVKIWWGCKLTWNKSLSKRYWN